MTLGIGGLRKVGRVGTLVLAAALPAAAAEVKVEGYAEWRRGGCLFVDAQRVCPAPGLRVKGSGEAKDFASIPLGYEVKAKGERVMDGAVLAREVEAKPNGQALFEDDLAREFDEVEELYRKHGRVFDVDEDGDISEDYGRLLEDGRHLARVQGILDALMPGYLDRERFRIYVVENEDWNAMAAPNGALFVFTGLLEAMDDDEVAIILGHELAHATHEHSRKGVKKGLWIELAAAAALVLAEAIDSEVARVGVQGAALLGSLAWSSSHGRVMEDQADRVGLRYAFEAGYDVAKAPRLWQRFAERYGALPKVVHFFLDEHSRSQDRAAKLQEQIRHNYSGAALAADAAAGRGEPGPARRAGAGPTAATADQGPPQLAGEEQADRVFFGARRARQRKSDGKEAAPGQRGNLGDKPAPGSAAYRQH